MNKFGIWLCSVMLSCKLRNGLLISLIEAGELFDLLSDYELIRNKFRDLINSQKVTLGYST